MEISKKRRVAHLGQHTSKKKCDEINDLVTDIMKGMDDTGNQKIYDMFKSTSPEKDAILSALCMPSGISNRPNVPLSLPKKFKTAKRHSLMEKARKNINYIKHNRSLPKPRAHLGGLHDTGKRNTKKEQDQIYSAGLSHLLKLQTKCAISSKNRRNISENTYSDESGNEPISSSSHLLKTQKTSFISAKIKQNMSDHTENTLSDQSVSDASSKCNKLSDSSSDSESGFESFIRAQKQDTNFDGKNLSKSRKKKKLKKNHFKIHKNKVKKNKSAKVEKLNFVELESVENKISRKKHCNTKITAKVSLPNRVQLDTSDSSSASADEKELSDQLFKTGKVSSMPSVEAARDEVVPSEQMNKSNLMCSVRIERNPGLEKTVSLLKTPLEDCDNKQNSECSELQGKEVKHMDECPEEIDEDCIIVCEVAKSNNHTAVDTCNAESGFIESDIQILNVVSLGECRDVTDVNDGNAISNTQSSSCDRNLVEINFEKLKEAIEITKVLESYSNASFNDKLSQNESYKNPYLSEVKEFNALPCSSSYSESPSSFTPILCENDKVIPENHWQNLKKAINMSYSKDEFFTTSELSDIQVGDELVKSDINRNIINNVQTPSQEPSTSNSDLNISHLREILSCVNHHSTSSRNNNFQVTDRFPLKKDYNEDPCDELDVLSAASARDLCPNQISQNVSKLLSLSNQECHDYSRMTDDERNFTIGLKLIEKNKGIKERYLETAIEQMLKHDPCLYSTAMKHVENNISKGDSGQSSESADASSENIKKCINCGSKSTIECAGCKKISFCSEKCGVYFWENGHYRECEGRGEQP